MLADLNRVDFANVQEQASWVCGCDLDTVSKLEESFKATLQQQVGRQKRFHGSGREQVVGLNQLSD